MPNAPLARFCLALTVATLVMGGCEAGFSDLRPKSNEPDPDMTYVDPLLRDAGTFLLVEPPTRARAATPRLVTVGTNNPPLIWEAIHKRT
ncbi:MAG: hypothetical protein KC561_04525 [Myxococcales bacterium]|nr:hypothetical protein [Myxococcales bacterium]